MPARFIEFRNRDDEGEALVALAQRVRVDALPGGVYRLPSEGIAILRERGLEYLVVRDSGVWAKRKHHFLRRYCDMLATAMKNKPQHRPLTYLDVMAGPGRCRIRETGEITPGSPFVALDYPFQRFVFIEPDRDSAYSLRQRVIEHPLAERCEVIDEPWETTIARRGLRLSGLTLAFVDPNGIRQVPWMLLSQLIEQSPKIDILMTVQHGMGIRLNQHQFLAREGGALDQFVGNAIWREDVAAGKEIWESVMTRYSEQMETLRFSTRKWIKVPITTGTNLYYLCLFSRHPLALKFWDQVVLKDEVGQTAFDLD